MNKQCPSITFGTSGWRAIIAREFTFENVRLVTQAIAEVVKTHTRAPQLIVGYDTRFLSPDFATACAQVLAANNIRVLLSDRDVPTPVLAYHIIDKKLSGGINFTASHNPPEYNGIKFSSAYGGPAPKTVTVAIEEKIAQLQLAQKKSRSSDDQSFLQPFDPRPAYLRRLKELVDFSAIRRAKLRIAVDCLYGTGRGYLDSLLSGAGIKPLVFHDYPNPSFGGRPPEPAQNFIPELIAEVKKGSYHLGLACDGDADRFGVVDAGGVFLTPNEVFSLLFYYLIKTRGKSRLVARSLATTHMIDAIARKEGMEVLETPVGFKYIGEALSRGDCLIGGEESGGLSIQGHVPEKDGILACLLAAEMVATERAPLREILRRVYKQYGMFYTDRINVRLSPVQQKNALKRIEALRTAKQMAGMRVRQRDLRDGVKLIFQDNCWLMLRPSGTEPVVRGYFEAGSRKELAALRAAVGRCLGGAAH